MNFTAEQVREMAVNVRDCAWPADVKEYMVLIEPMPSGIDIDVPVTRKEG